MKIDIASLSDEYNVCKLTEEDIDDILKLCEGNPLYYEYCPPPVSRKSIRGDMVALPPEKDLSDKYYAGFYDRGNLIAIIDLIDGYPNKSAAYIGFFMADKSIQKTGIGTKIISYLCDYLRSVGFESIQLAWVKGNPQAEHFWIKNAFIKVKETSSNVSDSVILAEKIL